MLKNFIQLSLQKLLGYQQYLFVFAVTTIFRLKYTRYDREFLHFIKLIPDGGIVLDIGANIGLTSIPLSKSLPNAQILSFEPIPKNIKAFQKATQFFQCKNVALHTCALGQESGNIDMITPIQNSVIKQGLSHVIDPKDIGTIKGELITVPIKSLDDLIEIHQDGQKVNAIKIDVENHELEVFLGARSLLLKHKPIIYCELWEGEKKYAVLEYVKELGYDIFVYKYGELFEFNNQKAVNLFFIPKEKKSTLACFQI